MLFACAGKAKTHRNRQTSWIRSREVFALNPSKENGLRFLSDAVMSQSRHMPAGNNGDTLGKWTSLHRSCMRPHNILIFVVTDGEPEHMLQWRSPEAHYQQNLGTCELQCFKYGCCCIRKWDILLFCLLIPLGLADQTWALSKGKYSCILSTTPL